MASQALLRIGREVSQIQQGDDLSLAAAVQDHDMREVKALILGPHSTPYEFGFFEFSVRFRDDYPTRPPKVDARTTNGGRCRFNPNIYAQGKVCLSTLGTWRGEHSGEEWSAAQCLESILISIQSLMSANPYENEPGFEHARSPQEKKNQIAYADKIRHETIRIAVIQKLEEWLGVQPDGSIVDPNQRWDPETEDQLGPEDLAEDDAPVIFEPFRDLCKRRFLWYYDLYLSTVETEQSKHPGGKRFEMMAFEGSGNQMDGKYDYADLKRRLAFLKDIILKESSQWALDGAEAARQELGIAVNLQRQHEQIIEAYKRQNKITLDIELREKNPFVWQLTYFGRPMTRLDGGIFKIRISLSPKFPDEQPRVFVETPLFHHHVSKDGVLCYSIKQRQDDMKAHIDAIIGVLEDDAPPYDPRKTVNPEASKMFWGSADEKKQYYRRLRRNVEESAE